MKIADIPRPDDRLFDDSPDAGLRECVCSRCGKVIDDKTIPIRIFVLHGADDRHGCEYRYHGACVGIDLTSAARGATYYLDDDEPEALL